VTPSGEWRRWRLDPPDERLVVGWLPDDDRIKPTTMIEVKDIRDARILAAVLNGMDVKPS
jgi:hypothetical protein